METDSIGHARYNINYHIVFCPKYRHPVLKNGVDLYLKRLFQNICSHYSYNLLEVEIMPDHVHLFISAKPTIAPTDIVEALKSISAILSNKNFFNLTVLHILDIIY